MDSSSQIIIDTQKNLAVILIPLFFILSFVMTAVLLIRNERAQQQKQQSFSKWLLGACVLFILGAGVFFIYFYFSGYFLNNSDSEQLSFYFVPLLFIIQGVVQNIVIRILYRPHPIFDEPRMIHPDVHSDKSFSINPKKFAIWLAPVMIAFTGIIMNIPALKDPNSKLIYLVAPIMIALPLVLIAYVSTKNKK